MRLSSASPKTSVGYASNSQYLTDGFGEKYGVSASMY